MATAKDIEVNVGTGRPIQIIPYKEKTEEWYKKNGNFYISRGSFSFGNGHNERKDLRMFYEVYNNQFPLDWFKHITDPLSAKKSNHKAFPAKVRPVTILRTNIDLLLGEYPRRPFIYNVENLGEDGYNRYTSGLVDQVAANLAQWFINSTLTQMQANGEQLTEEQIQQIEQNPPVPEQIKTQFHATYKDALAIKGQKWLRRMIREKNMKKIFHKMFKDWLIVGQAYSYKGIRNEQFIYERVSPLMIDYDKSMDNDYIEDGEWVVSRRLLTISDVVNDYYRSLTQQENKELESKYWYASPTSFYDHLRGLYTSGEELNKIPVYHVQWKGKRKIGFVTFLDPETMSFVEKQVDEDYPVDKDAGEVVEWRWINEVYECTRIGDDIWVDMGPVAVQRNEMNNVSACKLSYNGRKYSDLHAENISVLEMGIPYQIMYIIVNYILEKTIAKSKGKIVMIDQNAIPNEGDWDDEKFFYYAEALGYALLNRNQIGVDKTWNQYQVLDMGLFDQIKQLIELKDSFKQEWDDVIGITRQRKGQTYASDGQGVNERSVFQSTVITDMIFIGFEEFTERELQGTMDYCPALTSKGVRAVYNDDDYNTQLMEIDPEDFASAEMGVFVDSSVENMRKKEKMEQYAQAMIQNNAKASTVLEVIDSINIAELKTKLKRIEQIEQEIAQSQAKDEQEAQQMLEEIKNRHMEYQKLMDSELQQEKYDREEDLLILEKSLEAQMLPEEKIEDAGTTPAEQEKMNLERQKLSMEYADRKATRDLKQKDHDLKREALAQQIKVDEQNYAIAKQKVVIDRKKANKPTTTKK